MYINPFAMGEAASTDPQTVLSIVAHRMADHCAAATPSFNRKRFLTACGMPAAGALWDGSK